VQNRCPPHDSSGISNPNGCESPESTQKPIRPITYIYNSSRVKNKHTQQQSPRKRKSIEQEKNIEKNVNRKKQLKITKNPSNIKQNPQTRPHLPRGVKNTKPTISQHQKRKTKQEANRKRKKANTERKKAETQTKNSVMTELSQCRQYTVSVVVDNSKPVNVTNTQPHRTQVD